MSISQDSSKKNAKKRSRKKTSKRKNALRTLSTKSRKVFRQCIHCGGIVDQMYGRGDGSWCPHCFDYDSICERVGTLPDPQLYGSWLSEQEEAEDRKRKEIEEKKRLDNIFGIPSSPTISEKTAVPKTRKMHTGIFSCPECCVEFQLFMDETLKCDDCNGPLLSGPLDGYFDDEDEAEN